MQEANLSFRKPIITRGGNKIRLYHIGTDYIHGAYSSSANGLESEEDIWHVCSWNLNGSFGEGHHMTSLDIINEEEVEAQTS